MKTTDMKPHKLNKFVHLPYVRQILNSINNLPIGKNPDMRHVIENFKITNLREYDKIFKTPSDLYKTIVCINANDLVDHICDHHTVANDVIQILAKHQFDV